MLLLLLLIPLLVWLYLRVQRRRQAALGRLGSLGVVLTARSENWRRYVPPLFFLAALSFLILALARPQATVSLPRYTGTVILAFDVSGSMAADDLKPTRIDAAKAAASDFVQHQPASVEIGVVAFSDNGFNAQKPTNDQATVLGAIARLSPQRGTSLANGMLASLAMIAQVGQQTHYYSNLTATPTPEATATPMPKGVYAPAMIVLLTDGENNENPNPMTVAQLAADRGVRIFTIGIGSAAGTSVKINGFTVHTQLDEATLTQIAQMTDGEYYNASTEQDLKQIYDKLVPQITIQDQDTEVTSLFAGVGIVLMLIGGTFSALWFSRLP
jgi:Ca-activated chloride channel family protein